MKTLPRLLALFGALALAVPAHWANVAPLLDSDHAFGEWVRSLDRKERTLIAKRTSSSKKGH